MQPLPLRQHLGQVLLVEPLVGGLGQLNHPLGQIQIHRVHRPPASVPTGQCAGPLSPVSRAEPPDLAFRKPQQLPRLCCA